MTKSTITRERLQEIAEDGFLKHGESKELARMALAAMDCEPVAEVLSNRPGNDTSTIDRALPVGTQLYRHAQQPVVPDEVTAEDCPAFVKYEVTEVDEAWSRGFNACLAAMPQAGNSPVIPDGLIAAVNRLLDTDGSRGCYSAIRCYDAHDEIERLLAAAPQEVKGE